MKIRILNTVNSIEEKNNRESIEYVEVDDNGQISAPKQISLLKEKRKQARQAIENDQPDDRYTTSMASFYAQKGMHEGNLLYSLLALALLPTVLFWKTFNPYVVAEEDIEFIEQRRQKSQGHAIKDIKQAEEVYLSPEAQAKISQKLQENKDFYEQSIKSQSSQLTPEELDWTPNSVDGIGEIRKKLYKTIELCVAAQYAGYSPQSQKILTGECFKQIVTDGMQQPKTLLMPLLMPTESPTIEELSANALLQEKSELYNLMIGLNLNNTTPDKLKDRIELVNKMKQETGILSSGQIATHALAKDGDQGAKDDITLQKFVERSISIKYKLQSEGIILSRDIDQHRSNFVGSENNNVMNKIIQERLDKVKNSLSDSVKSDDEKQYIKQKYNIGDTAEVTKEQIIKFYTDNPTKLDKAVAKDQQPRPNGMGGSI